MKQKNHRGMNVGGVWSKTEDEIGGLKKEGRSRGKKVHAAGGALANHMQGSERVHHTLGEYRKEAQTNTKTAARKKLFFIRILRFE